MAPALVRLENGGGNDCVGGGDVRGCGGKGDVDLCGGVKDVGVGCGGGNGKDRLFPVGTIMEGRF